MPRRRQPLAAQLRYLGALLNRFRLPIVLVSLTLIGGTLLVHQAYVFPDGSRPGWARSAQAIYFLMIGNPTLDFPRVWYLELLWFLVPPVGVIGVADGLIRFAYLFFAAQRHDKEWNLVLAQTMSDHVVLCGAGRVGYRIYQALRQLEVPVLVVEKSENAAFVQALRTDGAAVIIEDASTAGTMAHVNLSSARALVCATDDDLANINIALDARRIRPEIRVVMRVFDEDLAERVENFGVDAFSTSALSAPAFAAASLDPGVHHSFWLAGELHVMAELQAPQGFEGRSIESLREQRLLVAMVERGPEKLHAPVGTFALRAGDKLHIQGPYKSYDALARAARAS
ncbi:MAG: NAD-binding protein [Deltaproteobacteria bacterium]|nr:NAD-binding protein [Deltaproteobacteria bacterium]